MFSIEIKINGSMIAHIYGHNEGTYNSAGETQYSYELYEVNKGEKALKYGGVEHIRNEGIFTLIKKILIDSGN